MVVRVAPLATVSQVAAGYAVTLEAAAAEELAPPSPDGRGRRRQATRCRESPKSA
jgi:hypothetical protein